MEENIVPCFGIRFSEVEDGYEIGRAYLYIMRNSLYETPFGLVEDVYVDEKYRGSGVAGRLMTALMKRARAESCYKLLATSRNDGTRTLVHDWYKRLGFMEYGTEFRMNL